MSDLNKSLTVSRQSSLKPPISRSELIAAMVELMWQEQQAATSAWDTRHKELEAAIEAQVQKFVLSNIKKLSMEVSISVYFPPRAVSISIPISEGDLGYPKESVAASLEHQRSQPVTHFRYESEFRKHMPAVIKARINSERIKLLLAEPDVKATLEAALLQMGAVEV